MTAMDAWLAKWNVVEGSDLGIGSFGRVFAGFDQTARAVAIKLQGYEDESFVDDFNAEIKSLECMKRNPHPNIICLYDYMLDTTAKAGGIIMELATMDLSVLLTTHARRLKPDLAQSFGRQMVTGIAHLHRHSIIHRDIKPQNLFVCFTCGPPTLKVGDFGSSKTCVLSSCMTGNMVTSWYRPPEVFSRSHSARLQYGSPVDVWSMGCVLWELCLWSAAFGSKFDQGVAAMIVHRLGEPQCWPPGFPDKAMLPDVLVGTLTLNELKALTGRPAELDSGINLLQQCLAWQPEERLSAEDCLKHPFCEELGSTPGKDPTEAAWDCVRPKGTEQQPRLTPAAGADAVTDQPLPGSRRAHPTASCTPALVTDLGQPDKTPRCQCPGHCRRGHKLGQMCFQDAPSSPAPTPGGRDVCHNCRCASPKCSNSKFCSDYCFRHAYESLSLEFRVIQHLQQHRILEDMMPLDIQAFLVAQATFKHDLALELISAWVKEPPAIALLMNHRPTSKLYTGADLLISLKQVRSP